MSAYTNESGLHIYRTEIPNILFLLPLDPYEFKAYCVFKKTAGDGGVHYKSNEVMAKEVGCSERKLQYIKESLSIPRIELEGKSLITITKRVDDKGANLTDWVTITNIWPINMKYLGGNLNDEGGVHHMHQGGAPHAPKEEPIQEEPITSIPKAYISKDQYTYTGGFGGERDRYGSYQTSEEKCKGIDARFNLGEEHQDVILDISGYLPSSEDIKLIEQYKLTGEQVTRFFFLLKNCPGIKLKNKLSFQAKNKTSQRIKDVVKFVSKKRTADPAGYIIKLLEEDAVIETDESDENKEYLLRFIKTNPWPSLEIFQKYAKFYSGSTEIEMPFTINVESFKDLIHRNYSLVKKEY